MVDVAAVCAVRADRGVEYGFQLCDLCYMPVVISEAGYFGHVQSGHAYFHCDCVHNKRICFVSPQQQVCVFHRGGGKAQFLGGAV